MKQIKTDDLFIEATRLYPGVHFSNNGMLTITGRIISDHLCEFFTPLFDWVTTCSCHEIHLEVDLDYLNSNGMFLLVELIRRMEKRNTIHTIRVTWLYEEEDEEHHELGLIIQEKLMRTDFQFISYV